MIPQIFRAVFSIPAAAALLLFLLSVPPVQAAGGDPAVSCRAVSVDTQGTPFAVLEAAVPQGWHLYSDTSPVGLRAAVSSETPCSVWYPAALAEPDGSLAWEGTVRIVLRADEGASGASGGLRGVLEGQICTKGRCLPQEVPFSVAGPGLPEDEAAVRSALSSGRDPVPSAVRRAAAEVRDTADVGMLLGMLGAEGSRTGEREAAPSGRPGPDALPEFFPRSAEPGMETGSFSAAVLIGMAAGFLLNFMPCVLPVVGIKIGALLRAAGGPAGRIREFSLFFALGTSVFFTLLALLLGAAGSIWGGLFQSEAFLMAMMAAVFLMALSLFGVFTLPVIDPAGRGKAAGPKLDAFASGAFATLLATPCSGPLLGGVLGWAFLQPPAVLGACAFSVGLGMGLPWLLLAARPALAARLPRPGAWMEFLERGMAFLLLATALYLMSLLPEARHFPAAAMLLAAGFCAWVLGRFFGPSSGRREKAAGLVLCAAAAACAFAVMRPSLPPVRTEYSHGLLMENLGRRNIILDFTADWCPNCKILEKTVLTKERTADLEKRYGAVLIVVDLTVKDAGRQALLEAMGSRSIPLTALIPAKDPSRPLVLRDLYTPAGLEKAAGECFGPLP